jgi:hypothetical protein
MMRASDFEHWITGKVPRVVRALSIEDAVDDLRRRGVG